MGRKEARQPPPIDEWGHAICGRCPLEECVKLEGTLVYREKDAFRGCPIDIARMKGWSVAQSLANSEVLMLLEKENGII